MECKKCGKCCSNPYIPFPAVIFGSDYEKLLECFNIKLEIKDDIAMCRVPLKCKWLGDNNECMNYDNRPEYCKTFFCDECKKI